MKAFFVEEKNKILKKKSLNDNWILSLQRATAIARILQIKYKIDPKRIIKARLSQYMPIDDNSSITGRVNNSSLLIVLMSSLTQLMNL